MCSTEVMKMRSLSKKHHGSGNNKEYAIKGKIH